MRPVLLMTLVPFIAAACGSAAPVGDTEADLVLYGQVWTGLESAPFPGGVAIAGDRILAVGDRAEIEPLADDDARIIETDGLITPGFIDTHVHFLTGGQGLSSVQLRDAATPEEFVARIRAFAATVPEGTWITNGDWDHEQWGGELPHRSWIDSVTPDHPVWVNRLDGHMALANTAALEAAGLTEAVEVDGGAMDQDPDGTLTGLLRDNAMGYVDRAVPDPTPETLDRALNAAMEYVAERGVTAVHDMAGWNDLEVYRRARADNGLRTRIYLAVPLSSWETLRDRVEADGRGDDWLRIGALKGFVDGSLGSHTAAFHEPFTDAPDDRGLLVNDEEDLYNWVSGADAAGLHVMVHAIGDRAN
ncbi:MAG TPA: amidohydrolase family protein, partial [Longimicrobiales bacterium]|nr:amidohydrolase family protein [Longimicrobiales bacterium]